MVLTYNEERNVGGCLASLSGWVAETFVVDKQGVIRFKQIGPVTAEALDQKILPLVRELQKS